MALYSPLLESNFSSIIEVRRYFEESIKELRKHLDACDNCPNNHYMTRSVHVKEIDQAHEYDYANIINPKCMCGPLKQRLLH